MKVGIIVISFNHYLFTKRCVESIIANTPRNLYKLCLVDNGSIDETKSWAKKLLAEKTLDNFINNAYNMGGCKASNQGMEWAMNDEELTHVLVMANDHIVTPNWLEPMLAAPTDCVNPFVFHSVRDIRNMYPKIGELVEKYKPLRLKYLQEDNESHMELVLSATYGDLNSFASKFVESNLSNPYNNITFILWPGLILYRKHVIEKVGMKDETYLKFDLASYADIDHYLRVYLAGFTSSVTMISYVHHWGSITTRKLGLKQEAKGYVNNEQGAYKYFIRKWGCSPHNLELLKKLKKEE